ncbi:FMN-binding negative transcriptional regulator [Variovorax sp. 54]|uniref:FMN-binding negative transcriptional regulator n=1 Tax=Variovorax sp. 54 TaxID=2035212 RepID=UPI000C19B539|nr:FMN-binding negative transcriptional regulator [Variovorax sp. 54]
MHIQPLFAIEARDELHRLVRAYPLASLFKIAGGSIDANLLPLEVIDRGTHGALAGHVARSHSLWTSEARNGCDVTVVFQSPNAFISPRWYVNGQRSGRLAPSWNYIAVQATGRLRFIEDLAWLRSHLEALTRAQEAMSDEPWSLADASPEFVDDALRRLVGFEIDILALTGKRFLSPQRTEADRLSLVENLGREASPSARALAALIQP